ALIDLGRVNLAFELAIQRGLDLLGVLAGYFGNGFGGPLYPILEIGVDQVFDRPPVDEVIDLNHLVLAVAVDSADALLDPHRVPGQVVVDADMAKLKIDAFAAGLRRNQEAHSRMVAEEPLAGPLGRRFFEGAGAAKGRPNAVRILLIFFAPLQLHTAVNHNHAAHAVLFFQFSDQVALRLPVFRENKDLLFFAPWAFAANLVNELQQLVELFVAPHAQIQQPFQRLDFLFDNFPVRSEGALLLLALA